MASHLHCNLLCRIHLVCVFNFKKIIPERNSRNGIAITEVNEHVSTYVQAEVATCHLSLIAASLYAGAFLCSGNPSDESSKQHEWLPIISGSLCDCDDLYYNA